MICYLDVLSWRYSSCDMLFGCTELALAAVMCYLDVLSWR